MYLFLIVIGFFLLHPVSGQEMQLRVELKQAAGEEVYLAHYYLGNIYSKDTIRLDDSGSGQFSADTLLPQGLYKIYLDGNNHFDFLLGADQQFLLRNDSFRAESLVIEGSEEGKAFVEYSTFLRNLQQKGAAIRKELETARGDDRNLLLYDFERLTGQLYGCWDSLEQVFPGSFLTLFVKANYVPEPNSDHFPAEIQADDSLLSLARFRYKQIHFWDHFDYTDERFLYTPFFKNKLETWFTQVLYQRYDSIKSPVFEFIEEVKPNRRIFQFVTSWFLNSSIHSNVMGMDALFVDIARRYYLSGEAFWATEAVMEKIRENVIFAEHNLVGMNAPELTLESIDGEYFDLYQIDASYTLVLIYEPNCSHCREFVPKLYQEVYLPYKDRGVAVFAIYSMNKREEWETFINEYHLYDWINVWDEHHVSRFKILYDARTTPALYLLDRNKKILGKKLSVEQVVRFLEKG